MIISIAHGKGGVGKTTVALNLAPLLKPKKIVDLDAHEGLSVFNKFRQDKFDLVALDAGKKEHRAMLSSLLREYAENEDILLIDCGGFDSDTNRAVIANSHLVLTPCNETPPEIIGLKKFDSVIAEIKSRYEIEIDVRVLYTKYDPRSKKGLIEFKRVIQTTKHLSLLETSIPTWADVKDAMKFGLGVVEVSKLKYSRAGRNFTALGDEINLIIESKRTGEHT